MMGRAVRAGRCYRYDVMRPALLSLCFGLALTAVAPIAHATQLTVTSGDLLPIGMLGWIAPRLIPPPPIPSLPMVNPSAADEAVAYLRRLATWRRAAGFAGVIYDNRDRGHSSLSTDLFPGLVRLDYGPDLKAREMDYGLGGAIILPAIVLGNSSTAILEGRAPRSQSRLAMTTDPWPARSYRAYVSNHIYVYPEHRDHDGMDLYPANWPYTVTSQGSSGSDQPFLRAIALTLAALPPATSQKLRHDGLIAPTIQMILRRSQKSVVTPEDYFSGKAHPTVFDADQLVPERMVALAASLKPDAVPPMVRLSLDSEDFSHSAGLGGLSERLFDTPSAIARVWRSLEWQRSMVVSAERTHDPNGRNLAFRWALLRGDPERVRIEPLDPAGTRAKITVNWQEPRPIGPDSRDRDGGADPGALRLSSRVDIGVFAINGVTNSAPAFVSISFPTQEARHYAAEPDGTMVLRSVDYGARGRKADYDPLLHWSAPWVDHYSYDAQGNLTGWDRVTAEGMTRFDAAGQRADGATMTYRIIEGDGGRPKLEAVVLPLGPSPSAGSEP